MSVRNSYENIASSQRGAARVEPPDTKLEGDAVTNRERGDENKKENGDESVMIRRRRTQSR